MSHRRYTTLVSIAALALLVTCRAGAQVSNCPAPAMGAFTGCYYNNVNLEGSPAFIRTDPRIEFDWENTAPDPSLTRTFSVRWQGNFIFDAGPATFTATTSDGMRVYVDGNMILDRWRDQPPYVYTLRPTLTQGIHLITVEYYEQTGWGTANLSWPAAAPIGPAVPVIHSFTATPSSMTAPQPVLLSWSISGANTVSIDNGVGDVSNITSKSVTAAQTVTYTLTAVNSVGTAMARATVTVNPITFSGQMILPSNIAVAPGDWASFPVTLATPAPSDGVFIALTSSDSTRATISPVNIFIPQGATASASTPKVTGIAAGSAIITASAAGWTPASQAVQVGMNPPPAIPAPVITSFTAIPANIIAGQTSLLSWSVSGATAVSIDNGAGDVSSIRSKAVSPTQTAVYTLTAINSGGSATARVTITVTPADTQAPTPPTITSAIARSAAEIDLVWTASTDNIGVTGYQISRNGAGIASVASTSLSYADTGVIANTTYTYTVRAYDAAANYSLPSNGVQVMTPAPISSTTITACRSITQSGQYTLGANLSAAPNTSCLNIHDTHDVQLDCRQHSVSIDRGSDPGNDSAISVSNVASYSIANCSLLGLNTTGTSSLATLAVSNSPQGVISNNTINGGYVSITGSDNLDIARNTSSAPLSVTGNNETIEYNKITLSGPYIYSAALILSDSTGSLIQYNVLNGGWNGIATSTINAESGADDGIVLFNVSNSTLQNNTILNTWDCGIENVKTMLNVQILNNQITTAGICGLGGWYGNSLKSVTIAGNTVTDVPRLFDYWRADGLYVGEQTVFFADNSFSNNKLLKPRISYMAPGAARLDFQSLPVGISPNTVVAANNRVSNNDFGPFAFGLKLVPGNSLIDGGGNICAPDSTAGFPLNCIPPTPPAGGYYALSAFVAGSAMIVEFGANPGASGDYIGLAAIGTDDQHWVSTQLTGGQITNALAFATPAAAGQYEFRYMRAGASTHSAVSNPLIVGK